MGSNNGLIDNKAVGKRIRQIRESNKLTQEEMAEILGVNPNAVRAYERGEYGISKDVMARIRQHFHVSIDYLLFGTVTAHESPIAEIINSLSPRQREDACQILRLYADASKQR